MTEKKNQTGLPIRLRVYRCTNCGNEQEIQTNNTCLVLHNCTACKATNHRSGEFFTIPSLDNYNYSQFEFVEDEE